jgi:hypothetical protein
MLNRKQLPLIARLNNFKVDIQQILIHCQNKNLLNISVYNDIKYSSGSKHQAFLVSNEFCKTNFFTEKEAPLLEGEYYRQLYLTDFDITKASEKVNLHPTTIFERTKRLNPEDPRYLPEADELNYGIRNEHVSGPFEQILNQFKSKITRVRLAYLTAGFSLLPHVDYDPSYITRYHIPLITNTDVIMGFNRNNLDYFYHMPAAGDVYFFNSGVKHWVDNKSNKDRLHLIIDAHGQEELKDMDIIIR